MAIRRTSGTVFGLLTSVAGLSVATTPAAAEPQDAPPAASAPDAIAQAEHLITQDRLIDARAALGQLVRSDVALSTLTDSQRDRAFELVTLVERRLRLADPIDVSLQKAHLALRRGELREAERHAAGVAKASGASEAQLDEAGTITSTVLTRRAEFAPLAGSTIRQAIDDFDQGRYAQAKAGLGAVVRSGVALDEDTTSLVDSYQLRIVALERARGGAFELGATLGVQPGETRRDGDAAGDATDAEQPADAAEEAQPGDDAGQPEEPADAGEQPGEQDVVNAALRAQAQRELVEADMAFEDANYVVAREKYRLLVGPRAPYLDPEQLAHARDRLQQVEIRLNEMQPGDQADDLGTTIRLIRQKTEAEFRNHVEQIEAALSAENTERARQLVASARFSVNRARNAFSEAEVRDYLDQLNVLSARVASEEERIRIETIEREEGDRIERERFDEVQRLRDKEQRLHDLLDRVRALQQELKYEEALEVVDQILFLEPNEPSGLLLRDVIEAILIYQRFEEIQRRKDVGHAKLTLDSEEAMIPPSGIVDYPDDWPQISFTRGELSAYTESPENRQVLTKMDQQRLPAPFDDAPLSDVIDYVAQVTALDVDVDWDSLSEIGIDEDTPVTLKLSSVNVRTMLDRVLEKASADPFARADWAVNDGILMIASDADLRKNTTLVIYNITDLLIDVPNFEDAPQIDLQSVLDQGEGGGQSPFDDDGDDGEDEERPTREEKIERIVEIVQALVDPNGWRDNGGETGDIQELNGSLIITNTPKNHRAIVGLLDQLREIRSMQINVETKFLLVNQDWFEQIGFDIDLVINANNNQVRAARGVSPAIQAGDFFDFNGTPRGIQRNIDLGDVDLNGDGDTTDPGEFSDPLAIGNPAGFSPVGIGSNSLGLAAALAQGDFAGSVLSEAPALGISGQFLDDVQVDFLIQATQADRRTVQLTAPRLTFTNGQTANIFVVTQQAFVSDLQPVTGDSAVGFDPEVDVVSEGVTLLVEGVISADRRYVTLNVDAGLGRIDGFAEQPVSAVAGGQLVNSADTQSFIQLPTVTVTRVRTTVTVPDQGTVLLGGQRLVTELEVETGVPVLSKMPILNRFFTNRVESKEEQTLLVLVKPTVLIQSEQEENAHPGLLDSLRTGVGIR